MPIVAAATRSLLRFIKFIHVLLNSLRLRANANTCEGFLSGHQDGDEFNHWSRATSSMKLELA
jgi:hypothetical protein